ncbi:unnamed protein product [Blepharisma stoltei]|uniref:Uncharacterized protein n=1 Tax=Blepharisma stoltei TaxID=1481888 RepID=A0AAU9JZF2_9CILI|nr:unnamed protein product [Blepharisma stoltei]
MNHELNDSATLGKRPGRWTHEEHQRFLKAIELYGKNWKKVEEHVVTRTGAQIRSHAQKYFIKIEKHGATKVQPQGITKPNLQPNLHLQFYCKYMQMMQYSAYVKYMAELSKSINPHQNNPSRNSDIFCSPQPVAAYSNSYSHFRNSPEKISCDMSAFVPITCGEPEKRQKQE